MLFNGKSVWEIKRYELETVEKGLNDYMEKSEEYFLDFILYQMPNF